MDAITLGDIFLSEVLGTAILIILGAGVVANQVLGKTKGNGTGWVLITFGWGFAVFAGVYAAYKSGAHLNPAVTLGIAASGAENYVPGIEINATSTLTYLGAQMVGAFIGAVIAYLAYKQHFDATEDPGLKLAVFATGAEIRNPLWNVLTEAVGTFILVFWVLINGGSPSQMGPLAVALIVVAIGMSLGGPTGYAINPARDLGPRIAHAVLPIKGKGSSDWGYSWIPVVGPIVGAVIAGLLANGLNWIPVS
ncbi:MIP/aquaporin family protein [Timonella senegalensis]|uniref:MIP/aquaporin family protein n=1 Tax=Timonella senegalensis TaxID=1465825 RepID=UPI0028AA6904|nr:MIP/aquaporin family protein [Timonella senegalensis]